MIWRKKLPSNNESAIHLWCSTSLGMAEKILVTGNNLIKGVTCIIVKYPSSMGGICASVKSFAHLKESYSLITSWVTNLQPITESVNKHRFSQPGQSLSELVPLSFLCPWLSRLSLTNLSLGSLSLCWTITLLSFLSRASLISFFQSLSLFLSLSSLSLSLFL